MSFGDNLPALYICGMRKQPIKLHQMQVLRRRFELSENEEKEFENLQAGFLGELSFDKLLDAHLSGLNVYHVKDYRFKVDGSEVQIDNLLISGDQAYTFEVKNYNFDLVYCNKAWHFVNGEEFKDLSMQVNRQRLLLQQLLKKGSFYSASNNVMSHLVFVNPKQTIYNMPNLENLIVPSNVDKRLSKICKSNYYDQSALYKFLESQRLVKSIYDIPVDIKFETLRPGTYCYQCNSTSTLDKIHRNLYKCKNCKIDYNILQILQNLQTEITALNDSWKITPAILFKLSGGMVSRAVINKYIREGKIKL